MSVVIESAYLAIRDEVCFRCGSEAFTGTIETLEINRTPYRVAFSGSVAGLKLDIGVHRMRRGTIAFRLDRPLLTLDESVEEKLQLQKRDYSDLMKALRGFPITTTGFGTYGGDQDLG